jgi:hypothetical protein
MQACGVVLPSCVCVWGGVFVYSAPPNPPPRFGAPLLQLVSKPNKAERLTVACACVYASPVHTPTGLAQMIAAMRPDIDNIDEYVRNTTARAFR